jgi:S1-C subfamily serine protease
VIRRVVIAFVLLLLTAGAGLADVPTGVPDPLSSEPLERGALLAMPAVWRVETSAQMTGIRTKDGQVITLPPRARTVSREGTAFGVTPDGFLVSAAHVVRPAGADLAEAAYFQYLAFSGKPHSPEIAREWVKDNDAVPVGLTAVNLVMRPTAAGAAAKVNRAVTPRIVEVDEMRDIAVVRVPRVRNTPSLGLDRGLDRGTPIATLGFGVEDPFAQPQRAALVPAVRLGVIGETGEYQDNPLRIMTLISNEVQKGDSGGPAVDERGRVRGIVLIKRADGGGAMAPTEQILRVLDRAGVRGWEGRTQFVYREALQRVSRFDLQGARADLRRTLASYPAHGLAAFEIQRVRALERARLALAGEPWYRGGLVAAGLSALVIAGILAALLWKAVNRSPGVLGPRDRKAPFDQDADADPDDLP